MFKILFSFFLALNSYAKICPGLNLVKSCGNQICEKSLGEDENTCPQDCNEGYIKSYNNLVVCKKVKDIIIPSTPSEIQKIIIDAYKNNKKIKPIGRLHSATDIICTEGIALPTFKLNQIFGIETLNGKKVVETESGVTVYELSKWLDERGYALKGLPHMGFRDVSVGGAIATASHGSSPKRSAVISNIVEAIEIIDGKGEVHYLEKDSANSIEFKALTANLGLLGVVTKIKFLIEPKFNLEIKVSFHKDSEIYNKGLISQVEGCDYGQLNWFPGSHEFVKTCGVKTNKKDEGLHNELLMPSFPEWSVTKVKETLQRGSCNNNVMCLMEKGRVLQFKLSPPFVTPKGKHVTKGIGKSYEVVSSHLTKYQEGLMQMDWEIAVPERELKGAVKFLEKHLKGNKTCLPLVGIFVRFAPIESKTLLGHTIPDGKNWIEGERSAFIEMPVYLPIGFSQDEMKAYEKQFEIFTTTLISKFHGRPHWGKNKTWALELALKEGNYKNELTSFREFMKKYDPKGIFQNKFSEILK